MLTCLVLEMQCLSDSNQKNQADFGSAGMEVEGKLISSKQKPTGCCGTWKCFPDLLQTLLFVLYN